MLFINFVNNVITKINNINVVKHSWKYTYVIIYVKHSWKYTYVIIYVKHSWKYYIIYKSNFII